jgi:hypothetical protein
MNKKYQVAIREVYKVIVDVEASSEEEAKVKAEELLQLGDLAEGTYDYTLPANEWQVREDW